MGIKLSAEPKTDYIAAAGNKLAAGFMLALGGFLVVLRRVILPHFLAAVAIFMLAAYALYVTYLSSVGLPSFLIWILVLLILSLCATVGFLYAFSTSVVYAIKSAATYAEDFFYELFEALKDRVRQKINSMEEGVAKQQAKVILDSSVREVLSPLKELRFGSVPAILIGVFVSLLTFVSRSVFLARLARISGATISFSAIFASRMTLVGALFLNMRWLATLLLWLLYGVGALVAAASVWLVC